VLSSHVGRRRLAPGDRRAEILVAALDLFAQRPADQVSVEDVAAAAHASAATVYHYFGPKPQLVQQVLRATADELIEQLDVAPDAPPALRLAASLSTYLDYLAAHPKSWSALLRAGHSADDPTAAIAESVDAHALAMSLDAVFPEDDPPAVLVLALRGWLAFVKDVCWRWLEHGTVDRGQVEVLLAMGYVGCLQAAAAADPAASSALERFTSA